MSQYYLQEKLEIPWASSPRMIGGIIIKFKRETSKIRYIQENMYLK